MATRRHRRFMRRNTPTERQLQAIAKPGDYGAGGVPGFALRVYLSGKRSWLIRYRHSGIARRMILGDCPGLNLKEARKLAAEKYAMICRDRDPQAERKAARWAKKIATVPIKDYVGKIARRYVRDHAIPRTRASTAAETQRILKRDVLPVWKDRRLSEITKADVNGLLDGIVKRGSPIAANRTLDMLNNLMKWAVSKSLIERSPCDSVLRPAPESPPRDRALSDEELARLLEACKIISHCVDWQGNVVPRPNGDIIKLLVLTGTRLSQASGMRWSEINHRTWNLPPERCKNNSLQILPLSNQVLSIIAKQPRGESDLVFGVNGCQVKNWARAKNRLDGEMSGLPKWKLDDLRRTVAVGMARLGVARHVVQAVLHYKSDSVAHIFNRSDFQEKRAALDLWGAHVESLLLSARLQEAAE